MLTQLPASVPLYFCSDRNHRPLRDQFVASFSGCQEASIEDDAVGSRVPAFELRETSIDDLGAMPNRAAGGWPVMEFKVDLVLRAIDECAAEAEAAGGDVARFGKFFVFSDVDIQCLVPPQQLHTALCDAVAAAAGAPSPPPPGDGATAFDDSSDAVDVLFQREFSDRGVNVGFMLVRAAPPARRLWSAVREEMKATRRLDQKVVNALVTSGRAHAMHGARCARLPSVFWASSNQRFPPEASLEEAGATTAFAGGDAGLGAQVDVAIPPVPLRALLLHHANFVRDEERKGSGGSRDPAPKLRQLATVRALLQTARAASNGDSAEAEAHWQELCEAIVSDPSLGVYRSRCGTSSCDWRFEVDLDRAARTHPAPLLVADST